MTNFLISIIIAISLLSLTGWGALELFQGARDSYDTQMLSLRLEQVGAAVKSNIRMIDGLPALPAPITTGSYPTLPTWISANAIDTNGHAFVYCPYALRPTSNLESTSGATTTVTGPGYNILTYSSSLFGTNSPSYVVGSDKPALYATAPSGTLTPGNTSGYGVTFTISGGTFSASNIGQMLQSGAGAAIITGYTNSTHVVATITQAFPSTSAIASGSWRISSVTPKGLLGFIIAFKPHDTYSAATAASWCNNNYNTSVTPNTSPIQLTSSGSYTMVGPSVSGLIYPIIVGQSQYQQAFAKTDNVTYYAAPTASGDGTGRNTNNYATLQSIMAQLAALRPARAYVYLASGTHSVTTKAYDAAYEPNNFRGITVTLDGGTNSPTISLTSYVGSSITNSTFNWPVNLILKNLTLSRTDSTTTIQPSTDIKWVFNNVTDNVPTYVFNNLWVNGTSSFGNILQVARNGKLYVNGTMNVAAHAGYFLLITGEVNMLPGASLTYTASTNAWDSGYNSPVFTVGTGSALNIGQGATLTITTSGVQMKAALGVEAGGTINMNNATLSIGSGSSTVAGATGRSAKGAIFVSGEMNINNSAILFPSGVSTGVAAVDLVDGGRFTMHNGSAIGSSSTVAQRPYYGVYDDGGSFVGGSSTGYSTGANGEGGSVQSNVYVQNSAGAMCWSGYPWPSSPASGSSAQQRHLFWDSPEGNGTTSTPRGTNMNAFSTYFTTTNASIITGIQTFTVNSATGIAVGSQVSIVSTSSAANYISGYVTAISGTSITVNVTGIGGSGTITAGSGNNTFAGGYDARHLILANQTNWACTNPTTTTSPTAFTFAPLSSCAPSITYITDSIELTGFNISSASNISINGQSGSNAQYSINGGAFTSSPGTIYPGNTLTLKATSAASGSYYFPSVTIGGTTYQPWSLSSNSCTYFSGSGLGNKAYIVNNNSTVSIVNISTGTILSTWTGFSGSRGIALSSDGTTAYVTNNGAGTVSIVNTSTGAITSTWTGLTAAEGIAVYGTTAYVSSVNNKIYVINTSTGSITLTWTPSGLSHPSLISLSSDGTKLYVTNQTNNTVSIINTSTGSITSTWTGYNGPVDVVLSSDGTTAYVTNLTNNTVSVVNISTGSITSTWTGFNSPLGIALSPNGTAGYVVNQGNGTVSIVNTSTGSITSTWTGYNNNPVGIVVR